MRSSDTNRRAGWRAAPVDGEIAFAAAGAAMGPVGACDGDSPWVIEPAPVSGGRVVLHFEYAGALILCWRDAGAGAFRAVGTLAVAAPGCAATRGGSPLPQGPCPACEDCGERWTWLWPAILGPITAALMAFALWLAVRPAWLQKKRLRRGSAHDGIGPDVPAARITDDVMRREAELLQEQLKGYRQELDILRSVPPPPPKIQRIEVPVERVVEVKTVHIEERPVEVSSPLGPAPFHTPSLWPGLPPPPIFSASAPNSSFSLLKCR